MESEITIWLNNNPYKDKQRAKPHSDAILQQLIQDALNSSEPVKIKKGENGKPFVDQAVYFSHSNSRQLHAYVVSTEFDIGLDVEIKKPDRAFLKTAERYFHPDEFKALQALSDQQQLEAFYRQWTRKEAWCKLEGGNLWSYLNKMPNPQTPMYFTETQLVDGFAVAIATRKPVDVIRINAIAHP